MTRQISVKVLGGQFLPQLRMGTHSEILKGMKKLLVKEGKK